MKLRITYLFLVVLLYSCGPKTIYKETMEIPNATWFKEKPLTFNFDIKDTITKHDILLNVRYKNDFRYTNQYVTVKTIFPTSNKVEDIVSLELCKSNGESNGKCSGESCTVPIVFQQKINFPYLGRYTIAIAQYSREDSIRGIESMELILQESTLKKS